MIIVTLLLLIEIKLKMGQCMGYSCGSCRHVINDVRNKISPHIVPLKEPTYQVALKAPNLFNYQYTTSENTVWMPGDDINVWIQQLYENKRYTKWILYNDQVNFEPHEKQSYVDLISTNNDGHCKGIIAWNNKNISWLVHSVPDFPQYFDGNDISKIHESKKTYGQSFACVMIPYDENTITKIKNQIHIMNANIFISNCYEEYREEFKKNDKHKKIQNTMNINKNIHHIAKSKKFNADLYEDYLMKEFCKNANNAHCICQTWIRGYKYPESEIVKNVNSVEWNPTVFNNIKYDLNKDHSKWCISQSSSHKWVCVGDVNRMTSQKTRGGGGFVIMDNTLHKIFDEMCIKN